MALAARQHGVVTTADLHRCGFGPSAIARVTGAGVLRRLHRGVYLVGPVEPPHARAMAALLACGPGAALSHVSAAALWEIRPAPDDPIHVIHPGSARAHAGTRPHRMALQERDVTRRLGMRVTRPARTLLDLARILDERELARAVEQAQVMRLVAVTELRAVLATCRPAQPRRPGAAPLTRRLRRPPVADALGGRAPACRADPCRTPAATAGQRARRPLRGRPVVAGRAAGRRGRRVPLPRRARRVRARPSPRRRVARGRSPGPAHHVARADRRARGRGRQRSPERSSSGPRDQADFAC